MVYFTYSSSVLFLFGRCTLLIFWHLTVRVTSHHKVKSHLSLSYIYIYGSVSSVNYLKM